MATRISKEGREIRSKLRLRFNTPFNCFEVYTTIHGSGVFKWIKITDEVCEWYKKTFNLEVTAYIIASSSTGEMLEVAHTDEGTIPNGT